MRVSKKPKERKAELIAAARILFDKKGVDKTRVSDIVHYIGVTQGVFYYYFSSKEAMIDVVAKQIRAELSAQIAESSHNSRLTFCENLAAFIELYINVLDQFLDDDATNLQLLVDNMQPAATGAALAHSLLDDALPKLIAQGVKNAELNAAHPQETAIVVLKGLKQLAAQKLPSRSMIYTITEQCLGIKKGNLTMYLPCTTIKKTN